MRILVLGATGMLGQAVYRYFKNCHDCEVIGTTRGPVGGLIRFDVRDGIESLLDAVGTVDYVINCIGITKPYCHDENNAEVSVAIEVNSAFPHRLAVAAEMRAFKVIQIATDCVFSGTKGQYDESAQHDPVDAYGKTKSMGEVRAPHFLNIRCSIVGSEPTRGVFLLDWFLKHKPGDKVSGFAHHRWNGVTTLQFAELCKEIIFKGHFDQLTAISSVHHFVPNNTVSKYELLAVFNKVYEKGVIVEKRESGDQVDRTLATKFNALEAIYHRTTIEAKVAELRQFERLGEFVHHTTCRFCGSSRLARVLDFGNMPLAGGFLKREEIPDERIYPLKLHFCEDCTLVQVNNAIPPETLFRNYFYFSSSIRTLVDHCGAFAREVHDRFLRNRKDASVFEIGCNDGVMLKPFAALGVRSVGMDPAKNVVESVKDTSFTILNDFFGERSAKGVLERYGKFDAITSSYSFAHIDDMRSAMSGVQSLLKDDGVFVFEVYYLGTLLDEMQYDMVYHEHCSYYSLMALSKFLAGYGMEVFDTKFTPGVRSGAVRFYARHIGKRSEPKTVAVAEMERYEVEKGFDRVETYMDYAGKVAKTRTQLVAVLDGLKAKGHSIVGYGASGRGTMIMNYCGIDSRYLDYVIDDAPAKHGYFTPGTHVEIRPWGAENSKAKPPYLLLFAWSFMKEVLEKRKDFLEAGGQFIVPLPEVSIVGVRAAEATVSPSGGRH